MLEQYLAMSAEFRFVVMDANQLVEKQQGIVRELVAQRVKLADFRRANRAPSPPVSPELPKRFKREAREEPVL
jgi:hypothetical protein